jgi:hypothetical protein
MKLPRVDSFLFYFSLKIGGYAIAGVSIFASIIFITIFSIFMARVINFYTNLNPSDQEFFQIFFLGEKNCLDAYKGKFSQFNFSLIRIFLNLRNLLFDSNRICSYAHHWYIASELLDAS